MGSSREWHLPSLAAFALAVGWLMLAASLVIASSFESNPKIGMNYGFLVVFSWFLIAGPAVMLGAYSAYATWGHPYRGRLLGWLAIPLGLSGPAHVVVLALFPG